MESYDDSKPSKYIIHVDVNNIYPWETSQYLLYVELVG